MSHALGHGDAGAALARRFLVFLKSAFKLVTLIFGGAHARAKGGRALWPTRDYYYISRQTSAPSPWGLSGGVLQSGFFWGCGREKENNKSAPQAP